MWKSCSPGGKLRIYWISHGGQPTRGGPPAWGPSVGLTSSPPNIILLLKVTKVMWCSRGRGGCILLGAVMGMYLGVCFVYYYDGYICNFRSNIGLYVSAKLLFICKLCLFKLCMFNNSSIFSDWPLFQILDQYSDITKHGNCNEIHISDH
jgi:hypothetical protein